MDTTSANYEIYDTLFTVFLTLYISLLAVFATEFCEGRWRRKTKDSAPQPGAPRPSPDSKAGNQGTQSKPNADCAATQEEK